MSIQDFKNAKTYWKNINAILKWKRVFPAPSDCKADISEKEISDAYHKWRCARYRHSKTDNVAIATIDIERSGFAGAARKALFLKAETVAKKMGASKSKYSKLETAEQSGDCTTNQIRDMAKAMDCELIYVVRPRGQELFSERIWRRLLPEALHRFQFRKCNPLNKSGALAAIAEDLARDPAFRRSQNWSRNEY